MKRALLLYVSLVGHILLTNCAQQSEYSSRFIVSIEGKKGFIDNQGEIVIEPKFDHAGHFSDGLAAVQIDGKWGFINTSGEIVIEPRFEQEAWPPPYFQDGMCAFKAGDKWGFITKTGKQAILPRYDEVSGFSEGLCAVKVDEKWGYIDQSGKYIIAPRYNYASNFTSGLATVSETHFVHAKLIDITGQIIINDVSLSTTFQDDIGLVRSAPDFLCYYIDKSGKKLIAEGFVFARLFHDGLAAVFIGDKVGSYKEREFPLRTTMDVFGHFGVSARFDGKWGFINRSGEIVIHPQYDDIWGHGFYEGLAPVKIDNHWGYIDKIGNIIIEAEYDKVGGFKNGIATVSKDDKYYYVNRKGNIIWANERNFGFYFGSP